MNEVKFLFDNQLIAAVESLIKNSKSKLLLVSPFIDIDRRIRDALNEKKEKFDFELKVLFGKNESNIYKSIRKDSLNFLKEFPNVEIRYEERLHAKFYQNDFDFIMTSLNLYDYSLANNIEVGIIGNYATRGFLGKVMDSTDNLVAQGVGKVTNDLLGLKKDEVDPIQKFEMIFNNAELKYKSVPNMIDKGGIAGAFGSKKMSGSTIIVDKLNEVNPSSIEPSKPKVFESEQASTGAMNAKCISASQIAKLFSVSTQDVIGLMESKGIIEGDKITEYGLKLGVQMRNYMGKDYVAYPENLQELKELKN